jgi:hypothetical protein
LLARRDDLREKIAAVRHALALVLDRDDHWKAQGEIARKGGHGPGSDF